MAYETNRAKVVSRLLREGWLSTHGGRHDKFTHPAKTGVTLVVPRHRVLSPGVARDIAIKAGW
jgi:mRNA interferase HicA